MLISTFCLQQNCFLCAKAVCKLFLKLNKTRLHTGVALRSAELTELKGKSSYLLWLQIDVSCSKVNMVRASFSAVGSNEQFLCFVVLEFPGTINHVQNLFQARKQCRNQDLRHLVNFQSFDTKLQMNIPGGTF